MLCYIFSHALYNKAYACAFQVDRQNYIGTSYKYNIAYLVQIGDLLRGLTEMAKYSSRVREELGQNVSSGGFEYAEF